MTSRDKMILSSLERFRVMSGQDVADIHFTGLKNPTTQANMVLKRLRRDGYVEANTDYRKFLYFISPSPIKKDSAKINHFLRIVQFYKDVRKVEEPKTFEVECKLGKGNPEPDVFMIWQKVPYFVELQRSFYSQKQIEEKTERYERYFHSDEWHLLPWQPADRKVFPRVWIIGEQKFNWDAPFKLIQSRTVEEILEIIRSK